jgi:tetratricopeptide (TPR) repeat protein
MRTRSHHWSYKICGTIIVFATTALGAPVQAQPISTGDPIEQAIANRQFPRALQLADAALRHLPRDWRLLTLRGRVLSILERRTEALEAYRRAIKFQPSYLPALEGAAEIEYFGGHPQARETLNRIIALQPANQAAHAMLGELAYGRQDCRDAVPHFELASNQVNREREALMHLGACLFELNQTDKISNVLEAPAGGVLRRRLAQVVEVVLIGLLLGVIAAATVPDSDLDSFVSSFKRPGIHQGDGAPPSGE